MSKIIVTGGAGFIGSNLVKLLLAKKHRVIVIDDFSVGKRENLPKHKNLETVKADVRDLKKMTSLFKSSDFVYHLATQCVRKSINNPYLVHSVNTEGTLSALEAAKIDKVKRFVYVSSSEVYGTAIKVPMTEKHPLNPTTIYGASKLAGEFYTLAYFRTYGINVSIVRPFNTYGYNEHFEGPYGEVIPRFVVRALNGLPLQIFGDGNQTRDFTFVTDTARGIYVVGKRSKVGETYNIARGQEVSILDLAKIILKILKVDGEIEFLPERPGDVRRHFASLSKAGLDFGFKAKYGIVSGIREYIDWFKKTYDPKDVLKHYEEKNW